MKSTEIRDMLPEDEYFVSTCTHENESDEIHASAGRRLAWLRSKGPDGLRVKVALSDGMRVGFLYAMPIELSPWGLLGENLLVFPCLFVRTDAQGGGVGRALVEAAEGEARIQGLKGVATMGYYWEDFWFMPAPFFERHGDWVVLREYCGDDHDTLLRHQIPRAIYVQGNEIGWGYEAPRDGIRDAIRAARERADGGEA